MSLWRRAAAEPKNKRPPLAVFYSVAPPRIPQAEERVRGKPLPVFPSRCGPSRPMARYKRFAAGKTLAQAEFTSAEHVQSPWGGAASRRGTQK